MLGQGCRLGLLHLRCSHGFHVHHKLTVQLNILSTIVSSGIPCYVQWISWSYSLEFASLGTAVAYPQSTHPIREYYWTTMHHNVAGPDCIVMVKVSVSVIQVPKMTSWQLINQIRLKIWIQVGCVSQDKYIIYLCCLLLLETKLLLVKCT